MAAAMMLGTKIPEALRDRIHSSPFGSCRLCLVEIEGAQGGTPASCTTPAEQGMVVRTQTDRLAKLRRGVMELYISDHPLDCLTCAANGDCELQDMAGAVGLREVRYGYAGDNHFAAPRTSRIPISYDPAKCIVCNRCVRACEETQGTFALTIAGRGFDSRVAAGRRISSIRRNACPAALAYRPADRDADRKSVIEHGQPDHSIVDHAPIAASAAPSRRRCRATVSCAWFPIGWRGQRRGISCVKGGSPGATRPLRIASQADDPRRITDPWREVSWEEAIAHTAPNSSASRRRMAASPSAPSPRRVAPNEEVFLVQKLVRAVSKTTMSTLAPASAIRRPAMACRRPFGTSAGTQDFRSVDKSDVIIVIGANPTDAHPVFGSRLKRRLRAGAKLDRRRSAPDRSRRRRTFRLAHHLQLRPGTNVALLTSLAHVIVTEALVERSIRARSLRPRRIRRLGAFRRAGRKNSPEAMEKHTGRAGGRKCAAAGLYATGAMRDLITGWA